MSQTLSLKEIERKAFRSFHQDGLWDIYLGLLLSAMGIGALLTNLRIVPDERWAMVPYLGIVVAAMVVLWAGKKLLTAPRIGRVRFAPARKAKFSKVTIALAGSAGVGLVAYVLASAGRGEALSLKTVVPVMWIVNCLVMSAVGAHFLDFPRLCVIGTLYAVSVPAAELLRSHGLAAYASPLAFCVPGMVIVCMGCVLLTRFLREHPVPEGSTSGPGAENEQGGSS